jgi:hypothetical protein
LLLMQFEVRAYLPQFGTKVPIIITKTTGVIIGALKQQRLTVLSLKIIL